MNDYKVAESHSDLVCISSKIGSPSNTCDGVIVFEISPDAIDSTMLNYSPSNGLGMSGESYLVGSDFLMRSSSRFQTNSVLKTKVETEAVNLAFKNLSGTKVIKDYRNISVLSSYSKIHIPFLNWVMVTEIDYKEATIPIYKIRNEIIFISIFIFSIVLFVIFALSRKITFPIQKLNHAAKEVGKGNLDISIKINSNDEIGDLTESFNSMVEKLKTQSQELETERMNRLRSVIDGQEAERQRLSRELHDSLGQLLIGLKLKYESSLNQDKPFADQINFSELFDKTIEETRRISNNLMPAALSEFGLTTAIRNICNDIAEWTDINIHLDVQGNSKQLNNQTMVYLFRIIQEALTNILKHSGAKNAKLTLSFGLNKVLVEIEDDGCGFDYQFIKNNISNGLNNINDRVRLLSGKVEFISEPSKGTKIRIDIPLKENYNG